MKDPMKSRDVVLKTHLRVGTGGGEHYIAEYHKKGAYNYHIVHFFNIKLWSNDWIK